MIFDDTMSLSGIDISIILLISFLTSLLTIIVYELIKRHNSSYINITNTSNIFYGKDKSGYLEKAKSLSEKTTYIECHFLLNFFNGTNHPCTIGNIHIVGIIDNEYKTLEEGTLNINGTGKSIAGVTSYDKLKNIVINSNECKNYDVNIRLSRNEYLNCKKICLCYCGQKRENVYLQLVINNSNDETSK